MVRWSSCGRGVLLRALLPRLRGGGEDGRPCPPLCRSLITGMRRSALKETLLRALRSQISHHLPPSPPETHFSSFMIDPRVGERWVRLVRSDDVEEIKIDATMVDGSAPASRYGDASDDDESNERLHITVSVQVSRKDSGPNGVTMHFLCSAWPDALDVQRVFAVPPYADPIKPYFGPLFKNLDDEVKKAVHDYLEERGVNDELAAFLHKYVANKDRTENIRWLQNIESYVKK